MEMPMKSEVRGQKPEAGKIESAIGPFRLGALQDYLTINKHLQKSGVTDAMLEAFLQGKKSRFEKQMKMQKADAEAWKKNGPKCPKCGTPLTLRPGDDNDCHLTCYQCRRGEYIPRPIQEVFDEYLNIQPREVNHG